MRNFYPRSPCGERLTAFFSVAMAANFYPRSPCGERLGAGPAGQGHPAISIHALLAESDRGKFVKRKINHHFYPRSPCGERRTTAGTLIVTPDFYPRSPCGERLRSVMFIALKRIFLSTLSLRRATRGLLHHTRQAKYFYPRSPCGERHCHFNALCSHNLISIHALLAESDPAWYSRSKMRSIFLSTLSLRRATWNKKVKVERYEYFYPRSPCGERQRASGGI